MTTLTKSIQIFLAGTLLSATAFCQTSVRDVDHAARHAYQGTVTSPYYLGVGNYTVSLPLPPAGQRLVVEQLMVNAIIPDGQELLCMAGTGTKTTGFSAGTGYYLPPAGRIAGNTMLGGSVRYYVDGGVNSLYIACNRNPQYGPGTWSFWVTVVGYTVDMNVPAGQ